MGVKSESKQLKLFNRLLLKMKGSHVLLQVANKVMWLAFGCADRNTGEPIILQGSSIVLKIVSSIS